MSSERGALGGADQAVPHRTVLRQVHRRRQQVRKSLPGSMSRRCHASVRSCQQLKNHCCCSHTITDSLALLQPVVPTFAARRCFRQRMAQRPCTDVVTLVREAAAHLHVVLKGRVIRRGDEHTLAGLAQQLEHVAEDRAAAGLHHDVLGVDFQTLRRHSSLWVSSSDIR